MNGNEYLIIEEQQEENIINAYIESIRSIDDVPEDFITHWIDSYLSDNELHLQDWESRREDI